MYKERLVELRRKIDEYIKAGGDIYAPKRQLPYYNYLADTAKCIRKETGNDVSIDDVYKLCGINFDREFNHFKKFLTMLTPFVKNGNADYIRTKECRNVSNVYEILKNYADKYNTMPFDFLVLMTGFKFENCYIKTDYINNLRQEILAVYPNGDISGIRWEYPKLYEKIRQLQKYSPSLKTMRETVEFLGFTDKNMWDKSASKESETATIQELLTLFPNKIVKSLTTLNPSLYHKVIRCCRQSNTSTVDWMKAHGFTYLTGYNQPRLSQTKVDANKRAEMLLNLKAKALQKLNITKTDEASLFHASLEATKMVIDLLNKEQIKYDLSTTDRSK